MEFAAFLLFIAFLYSTLNLTLPPYHQICQVNNQKFFVSSSPITPNCSVTWLSALRGASEPGTRA